MDRKKTIVIAVMVNAGLLVVLFITAMTMGEESKSSGERNLSLQPGTAMAQPLFNEKIEVIVPAAVQQPSELAISQISMEPVVHKLPPVASEVQSAIISPSPSAPAVQSSLSRPPAPIEIAVEKGDSLEKIAKKHRTSVDAIIKLNQLPSSFLKVGQRLKIPAEPLSSKEPYPKAANSSVSDRTEYYTMKVGDNPWSIAMKHHMKLDELLKLNGLNEQTARKLKPGDRLRIR